MHRNFDVETTFERFKQIDAVKINNKKYKIKVSSSPSSFSPHKEVFYVNFYFNNKWCMCKVKELLHERWLTINGILHYVQNINKGLSGYENTNFVKAEI